MSGDLGVSAALDSVGAGQPFTWGAVAGKDVLAHVRETILWHRHMSAVEQSAGGSGDVLVRESLRRQGIQAVQLAFDFAQAETALLNATPAGSNARSRRGELHY